MHLTFETAQIILIRFAQRQSQFFGNNADKKNN